MRRAQLAIQDMPRAQRKPRNPRHPFSIRHKPYQLSPFCMMPVLPGETLKNLNWQARVVTDPVKAKLVGWHLEYYWFYVKHRDLDESATLQLMMTNPGQDITAIDDPTSDAKYYFGGATGNINWLKLATKKVTEEFFREEGEAWTSNFIDGLPAVRIPQNGWWDSFMTDTGVASDDVSITVGVDDVVTASEIDRAMQTYEMLRYQGLTTQTYEEWLMTYGVRAEETVINKPELLRFTKDWQYPTNTVEPTTGVPSSAVSWSIQERADKDRYFKEPGVVVGYTVCRPKVYLSNLRGSIAALMNDVYTWLPATISNPRVGHKLVDNANALTTGLTNDFWIDFADLLLYGDQFVNFALTETDFGAVALPTAAGNFKYPDQTMVDALFTSGVASGRFVRQDGVAQAMIMGSVHDAFPGNVAFAGVR